MHRRAYHAELFRCFFEDLDDLDGAEKRLADWPAPSARSAVGRVESEPEQTYRPSVNFMLIVE